MIFYSHLIQELGETDDKTIDIILSQREKVTLDDESSQENFNKLSQKISQKKSTIK